jgi:hypothetical protein
MTDLLFNRAQLAIEDSSALREKRRILVAEGQRTLARSKRIILECAMARTESRVLRESAQQGASKCFNPGPTPRSTGV